MDPRGQPMHGHPRHHPPPPHMLPTPLQHPSDFSLPSFAHLSAQAAGGALHHASNPSQLYQHNNYLPPGMDRASSRSVSGGARREASVGPIGASPVATTSSTGNFVHHTHQHSESRGSNSTEDSRRKKRPRVVLSCTMCVRRKTKCDKVVPCGACVKRGDPSVCVVEGVEDGAARQPFALNDELVALRNRVNSLENLVATLVNAGYTPSGGSTLHLSPHPTGLTRGASPSYVSQPPGPSRNASSSTNNESDEESVAAVLQRLREGSHGGEIDEPDARERTPMLSTSAPVPQGNGIAKTEIAELDSILATLPNKAVCDILVDSFFTRVDWYLHVLHVPTFKDEYKVFWERFWDVIDSRHTKRDPSPTWLIPRLSTMLMVFSLGLYYLPAKTSPYSASESAALPQRWVDAAEKILVMADWTGKPQVRSIQTILLMSSFFQNTGEIDRMVVWIGAGVRIAQSLGLQSSDKASIFSFPHDTFRVSAESISFYNKELANRLWWTLCAFDWDVSYRLRNLSVLRAQDFTTPIPLNLSDEDLLLAPRRSRELSEPTVTTYQIVTADLVFLQQQWNQPSRMQYGARQLSTALETAGSLDTLVRNIAKQFPDYFVLERSSEKAVRAIDTSHAFILLQRLSLNKEVHCRIIRLNSRAIFEPQSAEATASRNHCRTSASLLLGIASEFRVRTDYGAKLWWTNSYSILACTALLVTNIYLSSTCTPALLPEECATHREEAEASLRALRLVAPTSRHTLAGIRVLELLLKEEEAVCGEEVTLQSSFDHSRYRHTMDTVSHATMCSAPEETTKLNNLADQLSSSSPVIASTTPTSGSFPLSTSNLRRSILNDDQNNSTANFSNAGRGGSSSPGAVPPFLSLQTSGLGGSSAGSPTDDGGFFRSLGLLPPPVVSPGGRSVDSYRAGGGGMSGSLGAGTGSFGQGEWGR